MKSLILFKNKYQFYVVVNKVFFKGVGYAIFDDSNIFYYVSNVF